MSEKKRPSRTSDEEKRKRKKQVEGKKGLERLADFTRRILSVGKTTKQQG